ncbi:MAG: DUF6724 family protein [Eggerthellaceae bacterium]|jgi:hypothetical protein
MDWNALYHFFFETFEGIGALVGIGIVLSLIINVILERRTRRIYVNHPKDEDEDEEDLD